MVCPTHPPILPLLLYTACLAYELGREGNASAGQLVVHCGQGEATQGKAAAGQLGKRQESCDTAVSSFSPLTPSPLRACRYCSYAKQ